MSPDTDLPVLGKVAAYAKLHPEHDHARAGRRHDHRLRHAGPRALRAAGLLQRGDVPGARLADRGEEDARPGDGRARAATAWPTGAGSSPT